MPRKTNGMPFEIHPSPKKAKNGKNILYVRPRSRQKITMEQLDDYCANHYALRPGELTRAFQAFIEATGYYLSEGYRVETLIGSFAPKIGLRRELTDPDEVKTTDVLFEGIEYKSVVGTLQSSRFPARQQSQRAAADGRRRPPEQSTAGKSRALSRLCDGP